LYKCFLEGLKYQNREFLAYQDHPDLQVLLGHLDLRDKVHIPEHQDHLALENGETQDLLGCRDDAGHKELLEIKEFLESESEPPVMIHYLISSMDI